MEVFSFVDFSDLAGFASIYFAPNSKEVVSQNPFFQSITYLRTAIYKV